ncbi:MAG: hypothetical protein U1B83_03040 [Candidatus Cloacimonadaceae bacterium]|nr:hypothetical protein [Candidatus Cloacimonadaceae bacterium]
MRNSIFIIALFCLMFTALAAEEWKVYTNAELGYTISYPNGFETQIVQNVFTATMLSEESIIPVTLSVTSDLVKAEDMKGDFDQNAAKFLEDIRKEMEGSGLEIVVEENTKIKYKGMDAMSIRMSLDMMMFKMKMGTLVFYVGDRMYMMMMGASDADFEAYLPVFEQFKDSLVFK